MSLIEPMTEKEAKRFVAGVVGFFIVAITIMFVAVYNVNVATNQPKYDRCTDAGGVVMKVITTVGAGGKLVCVDEKALLDVDFK
jgi:hypothetical protein